MGWGGVELKRRHANKPERQKRRESSMASIEAAMSTKMSIVWPVSERNKGEDNKAADRGRNPLSCFHKAIQKVLTLQKQII